MTATRRIAASGSGPLFVRGDQYTVLGWLHGSLHLFGVAEPARISLMGTDGYGRDQFSRLLFGGQVSLFAGLAAALLSLFVGLVIGGIAGAFGGWVDDVAMRVTEITMAVPSFYLLFTVRAFLPLQMEPAAAFGLVVVAIGLWNWARGRRVLCGALCSAGGNAILFWLRRIWRWQILSAAPSSCSDDIQHSTHTNGYADSTIHSGGSDPFFPGTRHRRTLSKLGQYAGLRAAVSHSGELLVDVAAGYRLWFR